MGHSNPDRQRSQYRGVSSWTSVVRTCRNRGNSSTGIWFKSFIHCKQPATMSLLFPGIETGYPEHRALLQWPLSSSPLAPGKESSQSSASLRILLRLVSGTFYSFILNDTHSANFLRQYKPRMFFGHRTPIPPAYTHTPWKKAIQSQGRERGGKTRGIPALSPWGQFLLGCPS